MPDLPLTWDQVGIILFWGGFSWWAFRWAYRNSKAQEEGERDEKDRRDRDR